MNWLRIGMDKIQDLFDLKWNNKSHQRRHRVPYTTRSNKHTKTYRALRRKRNKAALRSRKINRQRGQ